MTMRKSRILGTALALIVPALTLGGCGGGGARVDAKTTHTTTTMGQELMDLDAAFKKGIISEKEYDAARKTILKRYND